MTTTEVAATTAIGIGTRGSRPTDPISTDPLAIVAQLGFAYQEYRFTVTRFDHRQINIREQLGNVYRAFVATATRLDRYFTALPASVEDAIDMGILTFVDDSSDPLASPGYDWITVRLRYTQYWPGLLQLLKNTLATECCENGLYLMHHAR